MDSTAQLIAHSRKDQSFEAKRQCINVPPFQVTNENGNVDDARYVYSMLKEDFQHTHQQWMDATPSVKVKLSLPSLVDPLQTLSQTTIIIFFPVKLPSTSDVGQWVNSLLEGCFVKGVYFASRGFYEVHLLDANQKQRMLEMSPVFYGRQMVHAMPWSPNKELIT